MLHQSLSKPRCFAEQGSKAGTWELPELMLVISCFFSHPPQTAAEVSVCSWPPSSCRLAVPEARWGQCKGLPIAGGAGTPLPGVGPAATTCKNNYTDWAGPHMGEDQHRHLFLPPVALPASAAHSACWLVLDEAAWSQTARRAVKWEQGWQPPPSVMSGLRIKVKKHQGVVGLQPGINVPGKERVLL